MKIKKEQYEQIKECFPKQRKPAKISNLDVLNAVLYVVKNGCKWRSLPKEYGDWHVIYVRINRWAKKGVLEQVFLRLQQLGIIQIQVNRPLAKLGKAVKIADTSNQGKAKSKAASTVAVTLREDTKPFDKTDCVFNKDPFS